MEDKVRRDLLREIDIRYFKGSPPKLLEYNRKQTGGVYISPEELKDLLDARLVEVLPFKQYKKVMLTEHGKKAIYPERS